MKVLYTALLLTLVACSSKDPKMCACLEAGEKLNQQSAEILQNGVSAQSAKKMKQLKADKDRKCAAFKTMSGEEMLKKSEGCE